MDNDQLNKLFTELDEAVINNFELSFAPTATIKVNVTAIDWNSPDYKGRYNVELIFDEIISYCHNLAWSQHRHTLTDWDYAEVSDIWFIKTLMYELLFKNSRNSSYKWQPQVSFEIWSGYLLINTQKVVIQEQIFELDETFSEPSKDFVMSLIEELQKAKSTSVVSEHLETYQTFSVKNLEINLNLQKITLFLQSNSDKAESVLLFEEVASYAFLKLDLNLKLFETLPPVTHSQNIGEINYQEKTNSTISTPNFVLVVATGLFFIEAASATINGSYYRVGYPSE